MNDTQNSDFSPKINLFLVISTMGNLFASPTSAKENLEQPSVPNDNVAEPAIQKEEIPLVDIIFSGPENTKSLPITNPSNCFSVLSYNILAEVYSRFLSKDVAEKFLDISYRSVKIVRISCVFLH